MGRQHGHVVGCDHSVSRRTTTLPPFFCPYLLDPYVSLSGWRWGTGSLCARSIRLAWTPCHYMGESGPGFGAGVSPACRGALW